MKALALSVWLLAGIAWAETPASLSAGDPTPALGEPLRNQNSKRSGIWSLGLSGLRHSLKAGDGHAVLGNAAAVQLGTGSIFGSWYTLFSLDILLGPQDPVYGEQLSVDFQGTGITAWMGFSAQTLDLRSEAGGYGFALGLSYADIVGRSIGGNRKDRRDDRGQPLGDQSALIDNYVMRVNNLSLLPGIFFSWLKPVRLAGNTPELLATRTEGYILTLGMAMPLLISYQAKYERLDGRTENDHGQLRGYSILVTLTALFGT